MPEDKIRKIDIRQPVPLNVEPVYHPKKEITERDRQIAEIFQMPACALDLTDFFFSKEEQDFALQVGNMEFHRNQENDAFLNNAFHHGIVCKVNEEENTWKLNTFYGILDVFCVSRTAEYRTLSREKRRQLDDWYFQAYVESLDPDLTHRPMKDRILTRDEMLSYIDQETRPMVLNYCDCKSLSGDCGLPSHTCISFSSGPNSFQARGLSMPITKEEAKDIIRQADDAGLVHTLSDHGICNCCEDCCYLFRTQRVRNSIGFWPASGHIISILPDRCVGCGLCMKRCHFDVFSKSPDEKHVICHTEKCQGCGLCVNTCPSGALKLVKRTVKDIHVNEKV